MKIIQLFFFATLFVAFLMCSKNHTEIVEEKSSIEMQVRGEPSQNDTTDNNGGVNITIGDRPTITADPIVLPEDKEKSDISAPCDTIPNDTIPNDSIPCDSILNNKVSVVRRF